MTLIRLTFVAMGLGLTAVIIFAMTTGNFEAAGNWLMSDPWGVTTLVDLYLGLAISALIIAFFERRWQAVLWILPLPILGNVWTALWLVIKLPELSKRLGSSLSRN